MVGVFEEPGQEGKECVKLHLSCPDMSYTTITVFAVIVPKLFTPVLLGLPFLDINDLVSCHHDRTCIHLPTGRDILMPGEHAPPPPPTIQEHREACRLENLAKIRSDAEARRAEKEKPELKSECLLLESCRLHDIKHDVIQELCLQNNQTPPSFASKESIVIGLIKGKITHLAFVDRLACEEAAFCTKFKGCFPSDIPPIHQLPDDVHHRICLRDPNVNINQCSYSCPKQYRETWKRMLDEHIAAGCLRPSSSPYTSPAFLIPKADPKV